MTLNSATYHLRNICLAAVTLTFAALLPSCIYDSYEEPAPAPEEEETVTVKFNIVSRTPRGSAGLSSRADVTPDNPYGYDEKPGTAPENYIDMANRDFRFLLFDISQRFLCDFTTATTVSEGTPGSDGVTTYECTASINKEFFKIGTGATNVSFYILATVNSRSMRQTYMHMTTGVTTMDNVLDYFCNSAMNTIPDADEIFGMNGQHIPMSGVQQFTVSIDALSAEDDIKATNISDPALPGVTQGAPVSLLRSMAKVQVIDRLYVDKDKWTGTYDPADAEMRIASVQFAGIMTAGSLTPSKTEWADRSTTKQVAAATRPGNGTYVTADETHLDFVLDTEVNKNEDTDWQEIGVGYRVFSCYLWENDKEWLSTTDEAPKLIVTLAGEPDKHYEVPFAPATQNPQYNDYSRILRNHIYTFEIVGIAGPATLSPIYWTVCPMDNVTVNIPEYN